MKKLFFLLSVAMSLVATNASATTAEPVDTIRAYAIDGQVVRNFTGKELIGKTVKEYNIINSTCDNGDGKGFAHVLQMHMITTDKAPVKSEADRPVTFIDGIPTTYESLNDVKPEDIRSIDVIKNQKMLDAYAKQGVDEKKLKNGVIRVTTKKLQADKLVYLVDGVQKTTADVKRIPSDKIKSIDLIKKGSSDKYAKLYGKDMDVIVISTK